MLRFIGGLVVLVAGGAATLWGFSWFMMYSSSDAPQRMLFPFEDRLGNERMHPVVTDGILIDRGVHRYTFAFNLNLPEYLKQSTSTCRPPTEDELEASQDRPGLRLEGICEIETDDGPFVAGFLSSAPR